MNLVGGLFVVPGVKNSQKMQENPQMRVLLYFDLAIGLVVVIEGRVLNSFLNFLIFFNSVASTTIESLVGSPFFRRLNT